MWIIAQFIFQELNGGPRAEDVLTSLRTGPSAPVQKSQDIIAGRFPLLATVVFGVHPLADMTTMVQNLSTEFSAEIKAKQDSLDLTQAHLRAATRELAEQRKQIQSWQSRCTELDQVHQRIRNLEKAIAEEDNFDWTGRTDLDGRDGRETGGPAFQWRGPSSTMVGVAGSMDISFSVETEPPIPTTDSLASLIRLRRMNLWYKRMEELMEARLKSLQGASAEKEYQCKKIVSLCTGIPVDKVEDVSYLVMVNLELVCCIYTCIACSDAGKPGDCDGERSTGGGYCSGVWVYAEGTSRALYDPSPQNRIFLTDWCRSGMV